MRDHGGFEHNLQSLRVVDLLEERYAEFPGLNLTFETREGILKHCSVKTARTLGELGERFIHKRQPGLEAQLANLADEIAYNNHDVDDGLRSGLLQPEQLDAVELFAASYREVGRRYPDLPARRRIHETIRRMIGVVVTDLIENSRRLIEASGVRSIDDVRNSSDALISYSPAVLEQTRALKRFLRENLYAHERVGQMSAKAANVVRGLFEAFAREPRLMPPQYQDRLKPGQPGGPETAARVIADYIAGMTDRYAMREYARLFHSESGL